MRTKKVLKMLNKALKNDHLYDQNELSYMRKQLKILKEEIFKKEVKNYKGFGKNETN